MTTVGQPPKANRTFLWQAHWATQFLYSNKAENIKPKQHDGKYDKHFKSTSVNIVPSQLVNRLPNFRQFCISVMCRSIGMRTSAVETSCARGDTICPRPSPPPMGAPAPRAPPSRRNVAVISHAQYVLTVTAGPASCVKAAVSKAAWWLWSLTFWPWKWCPSHMWRGLPLCRFWSY